MSDSFAPVIEKAIQAALPDLKGLCRFLHDNPELGLKEFKAKARFAALLEKRGFPFESPCGGLETAFRTESGASRGKVFAFCAEYDALARSGHACGHNLISTAALTAFLASAAVIRTCGLPAKTVLLGTPAEETYGGKCDLLRAGVFDGLDMVFGCHPYKHNAIDFCDMAVSHCTVDFYGKAAHAASEPQSGVNALDAMTLLMNAIACYRQQMPQDARFHGIVTDGGQYPNIIPAHTSAFLYLRGMTDATVAMLEKCLRNMAKGAALMTGCRARVRRCKNPYSAGRVDSALADAAKKAMAFYGIPAEDIPPWMASTDFANVSQVVPAVNLFFNPLLPGQAFALHTQEFARAAATEHAFEAAVKAGKAMALAACMSL